MFSYKVCLALGAILLVTVGISTTSAECPGCYGDELLEMGTLLKAKKTCWFAKNHHYVMPLKLKLLKTVTEQLRILLHSTNDKSPPKCQIKIEERTCNFKDTDEQADCLIDDTFYAANKYNDVEDCNDGFLDAKQLNLCFTFINGLIEGWKRIHTTC